MDTTENSEKTMSKSASLPRKPSVVWSAMKSVKTNLRLTNEGSTPVNWKVISLVFISLVGWICHNLFKLWRMRKQYLRKFSNWGILECFKSHGCLLVIGSSYKF